MRIVGELEADRPAPVDGILHLRRDLRIGQVGQEREGALGETHDLSPCYSAAVAVGTKSGVSVEA
jgi:hypothetical protein